jgi:GTPase SAR1 family protein
MNLFFKRENVLRVKSDDPSLPIILIGNKSDLHSSRRISYDEAFGLAQTWNIQYIETSAKTRENVDKAFSEIFVRIKELKANRHRLRDLPGGAAGKKSYNNNNNLTKEEEDAIRADSMRKRIQKYFKNAKKRCFLS